MVALDASCPAPTTIDADTGRSGNDTPALMARYSLESYVDPSTTALDPVPNATTGNGGLTILTDPQPLASETTAFRRDLLFVIASLDAPSGTAVIEGLEAAYDERLGYGRVYGNLRELVAADLVDKRPIDGRTNGYRLTEQATNAVTAHIEWERACMARDDWD